MTRRNHITNLEEIRNAVNRIGDEFAAIVLTDATEMEAQRHIKTAKAISGLCDRLYEDAAISTKVLVDKAETGEQGDLFDKE